MSELGREGRATLPAPRRTEALGIAPSDPPDSALEQLLQTAERSREAVAIAYKDGTLFYTNPAFEALHGYAEDELVGQPAAILLADADPEGTVRRVLESARTEGSWEGEFENLRKDGTRFSAYALITAVPGEPGTGFVVSKHPVHPGEPPSPEVRDVHEDVIRLAGVVPGLLYRCENEPRWTMRVLSGEVEAITGYPPDALMGNREVAFADLIHPSDRTPVWESVQRQLADTGTFRVQYRLIDADGTEHTVWEKGRSIGPDPEGVELLEGSILDTTEQRETRKRLEEMRDSYRQLFEGLSDAAFVHPINPDGTMGRFLEVNEVACERLGYSREELLAMTPADLDAARQKVPSIADRLREEGRLIFQGEHVARDGTSIPVEISARLLAFNGETAVLSLARDLRNRRARERLVLRLEWALNVRWRINRGISRFETEADLLQDAVEGIAWAGEFPLAWIGRLTGEAGEQRRIQEVYLSGEASQDLDHEAFRKGVRAPDPGDPLAGALESSQVWVIPMEETAPGGWQSELRRLGLRSGVFVPLMYGEEQKALLGVASWDPAGFEHTGQLEVLEGTASDLAFGIQALETKASLAENLRKRERVLSDTIRGMARMVDERDPYTAGHQDRVAQLSVAIAREMGLDEERIQGVQLGAWIHDLGKLKVPTDILNKPGQLSANELGIIQEHAEAGYRILESIEFPWPIQDMVRHHHERLDGSGYPDGLTGEQLSPEVRILAVADVMEAITSHRPYRPALGMEKALAILRTERGEKLDPEVVDTCLALFEEGRFQWGEEGGS